MDILIRRARADDVPQICALLAYLFSMEADFSPDGEKQARALNLLISDASGSSAVFIAENEGRIVGMCSVQMLISTAEGGPAGLVEDLIIRPEHRGKGIGTELLSEIVRWCAAKKITRLQLLRDADNMEALKFYTATGWFSTSLICMRKYL